MDGRRDIDAGIWTTYDLIIYKFSTCERTNLTHSQTISWHFTSPSCRTCRHVPPKVPLSSNGACEPHMEEALKLRCCIQLSLPLFYLPAFKN